MFRQNARSSIISGYKVNGKTQVGGNRCTFAPAAQFEEKDVSLQRIVTQFSMMNPDDEEFCICH